MTDNKKIFVCGGAGYIGSHVARALALQGFQPVVVDNLSMGHDWAVKWGPVETGDIGDRVFMETVLKKHSPRAVVHLAASIEVGMSVADPASFYENNVVRALRLFDAMLAAGVTQLVFSSTAATYGMPSHDNVIVESDPAQPINPYGDTKLAVERALRTYDKYKPIRSFCLRYFNAAGAAADDGIGEAHQPETHLIPLALQAAYGQRDSLTMFGRDYPTPDGTCVRDYVHVNDIADAHVKALEYLDRGGASDFCNLGTGRGSSVREVIEAAETASGRTIKVIEADRRAGDPPRLVASHDKATKILGWQPTQDLAAIVASADAWHRQHFGMKA